MEETKQTFLDRLKLEQQELQERLAKLSDFLASPALNDIVPNLIDRELLHKQSVAMMGLLSILTERVSRASSDF